MIRLLQWLIFGHVHEWEVMDQGNVKLRFHDTGAVQSFPIHVLRCKSCGITRRKVLDQTDRTLFARTCKAIVTGICIAFIASIAVGLLYGAVTTFQGG